MKMRAVLGRLEGSKSGGGGGRGRQEGGGKLGCCRRKGAFFRLVSARGYSGSRWVGGTGHVEGGGKRKGWGTGREM
eukprot:760330-Hanusia_phi.AAC.2